MTEDQRSNTAILYFSRTPMEEARRKSFSSEKEFYTNFRIAGLLRSHTQRQIEKTALPYFLFDERNQKGVTFGEKLTEAFKAVFRRGYDYVIAVGNDTPRLESHHILEAAEQLKHQTSDIVLGPAADGGTWLMGFSRISFEPEVIKDLAWNSQDLLESIFEQINSSFNVFLLEKFEDVDNEEDLLEFLRLANNHEFLLSLKKSIRDLLDLVEFSFSLYQTLLFYTNLTYNFLLRAPPSASDFHPTN